MSLCSVCLQTAARSALDSQSFSLRHFSPVRGQAPGWQSAAVNSVCQLFLHGARGSVRLKLEPRSRFTGDAGWQNPPAGRPARCLADITSETAVLPSRSRVHRLLPADSCRGCWSGWRRGGGGRRLTGHRLSPRSACHRTGWHALASFQARHPRGLCSSGFLPPAVPDGVFLGRRPPPSPAGHAALRGTGGAVPTSAGGCCARGLASGLVAGWNGH